MFSDSCLTEIEQSKTGLLVLMPCRRRISSPSLAAYECVTRKSKTVTAPPRSEDKDGQQLPTPSSNRYGCNAYQLESILSISEVTDVSRLPEMTDRILEAREPVQVSAVVAFPPS